MLLICRNHCSKMSYSSCVLMSCYKTKTIARGPYKQLATFVIILETKPTTVQYYMNYNSSYKMLWWPGKTET